MSDPITFARWRDARADPPPTGSVRLTDEGPAQFYSDGEPGWYDPAPNGDYLDPQPTVWTVVRPPGDDPLTIDDLRTLVGQRTDTWEEFQHAAARVRALLPGEDDDE